MTPEQQTILNFLLGSGDIDGVWFGDEHPTESGQFWWRSRLQEAFLETKEPEPYDQSTLELCEECGWKTVIHDEGCLNCARLQKQEPVGSVVSWLDGSLVHGWFGEPPPEGTLLYTAPPRLDQCPGCGVCEMLCKRGQEIDERYASRLAFLLECMLVDSHGHWNEAANLLDEYKSEWQKLNPSPPTFMGEPVPSERKAIYAEIKARREAKLKEKNT
jgi:hypothetical protein